MANNVSFIIELQNRFSKEAEKIRTSVQRLNGKFTSFNRKIKKASIKLIRLGRKAKEVGKSLVSFGKSFALKVSAPIAAFNALSIRGFDKQDKALAKITRTILTTGGAARLSVKQLTDEAVKLQNKTLFGDETILNDATAVLLTFTGIAGKNFLETQKIVLDLSTLMGTDLKSASLQLGKALNDPVANLGALSRTGIQFSVQQKEVIKNLASTGQLAQAQGIILKELNRQFGGLAEAAAEAGTGLLTQLFNAFGDLMEQIGRIQFGFLKPLIETLKELSISFSNLSPGIKKAIAIILLIISVLGPLIFLVGGLLIGFAALTIATGFLGVSLSAIIVPILIVIAVIAAIVVAGIFLIRHWETLKNTVKELWETFKTNFFFIIDLITKFNSKAIDFLLFPLTKLIEILDQLKPLVASVFSSMINSVTEFGKTVLDFMLSPITAAIDKFQELKKGVSAFFFGGDEEKKIVEEVKATLAATPPAKIGAPQTGVSQSQTDININLRAPEKVIENTKTRSTGNQKGLNVGMNVVVEGA